MYSVFYRFLKQHLFRALFLGGLVLALGLGQSFPPFAPNAAVLAQDVPPAFSPDQLVQDGIEAYQIGAYAEAIATWNQALAVSAPTALMEQAVINENLARAHQQIGQTEASINFWQAAARAYEQSDQPAQFSRMLTEQAQVFTSLGQQQRAAALLCEPEPAIEENAAGVTVSCPGGAYAIAKTTEDLSGQAAALGSLAETYRLRGLYDTSQSLLKAALQLVQTNQLGAFEAPLLTSLGNTYARQAQVLERRAEAIELLRAPNPQIPNFQDDSGSPLRQQAAQKWDSAQGYLDQAQQVASQQQDLSTELKVHLSLLPLYQRRGEGAAAYSQQRLGELINQLPNRRETAYAAITLAKSYQTTARNFDCKGYRDNPPMQAWLEKGRRMARVIGDQRAESFALGELGHLEECRGQLEAASQLTNQAQVAASTAQDSADSLYLWEWQAGRIHHRQQNLEPALAAYAKAVETLDSLRSDLLSADRELQFDFRDTVEPVYRQYIELQLGPPPAAAANKQVVPLNTPDLTTTLKTLDALRLAELQNFFGSDCVLVAVEDSRERLLAEDPYTTIISSIVLPEQTALIASFPDGTSQTVWVGQSDALRETADDFRLRMKRYRDLVFDHTAAEELYERMIQPLVEDLDRTQTQTLVFVQDGFLRNIPMAALYDGNRYLIQRYAVATTPSLNLTAPRADRPPALRALAVGLSQETTLENGRTFSALLSVEGELDSISEQLPGSKTLLNEAFTLDNFKSALGETSYPILHVATHGQFSTIPEETFVITGPDSAGISGELTFGQLENLIREASPSAEPLDLITLTACETATGDDRATLGLAGVAIRAGARSAIASLWRVDDDAAAELIGRFYSYLQQPGISKAKALQAAQVEAIETARGNANPGKWSPLILVGNWQ